MQLDLSELSTRELYGWMVGLITPRPIAWVSTLSAEGIANLAPFSFFNGVSANPPTIVFCPANRRDGTPKDTLINIQRTGQFAVNLVTDAVAERMNQTSAEYEPDVDEFEMSHAAKAPSVKIKPPRVAASAASLECELHHAVQLGVGPAGGNLVVGRIVHIHLDDGLLDEQGRLVPQRLCTIGRMGGNGYIRTTDQFEIARPPRP